MNQPINVLHLLGTAQPEGSGIAKIVAALAQGLNSQKYKLHVWFLKSDGPLVARTLQRWSRCALGQLGEWNARPSWCFTPLAAAPV